MPSLERVNEFLWSQCIQQVRYNIISPEKVTEFSSRVFYLIALLWRLSPALSHVNEEIGSREVEHKDANDADPTYM